MGDKGGGRWWRIKGREAAAAAATASGPSRGGGGGGGGGSYGFEEGSSHRSDLAQVDLDALAAALAAGGGDAGLGAAAVASGALHVAGEGELAGAAGVELLERHPERVLGGGGGGFVSQGCRSCRTIPLGGGMQ